MSKFGYYEENGCPDCGASGQAMLPQAGCVLCQQCGFSPCG